MSRATKGLGKLGQKCSYRVAAFTTFNFGEARKRAREMADMSGGIIEIYAIYAGGTRERLACRVYPTEEVLCKV